MCMKQPFSEVVAQRASQKGVALPIVAAIFFALLTILGVSVDAGNLYRAQLRLQRSVDAAAIGGTYLFGEVDISKIQPSTLKIAQSNIQSGGLFVTAPTYRVDVGVNANGSNEIQVRGTAQVPLLILRLVPGFLSPKTVSAYARSVASRAIISLVVDLSGSMNCQAEGACQVHLKDSRPTTTKLFKMKEAAIAFINMLNEGTNGDQVALIGFNNSFIRYQAMAPLNKSQLIGAIQAIPAPDNHAMTNIQSGIQEGDAQFTNFVNNVNNDEGVRKFLVLISDGAPTESDEGYGTLCNGIIDNGATNKPHFIRALQAGDASRATNKATIYTIGYGQPDPMTTNAYQSTGPGSQDLQKRFLLRRIANSSSAKDNPTGANDFDCIDSYQNYNNTSGRTTGEFFETASATELKALLIQVAKSIKARMVE